MSRARSGSKALASVNLFSEIISSEKSNSTASLRMIFQQRRLPKRLTDQYFFFFHEEAAAMIIEKRAEIFVTVVAMWHY